MRKLIAIAVLVCIVGCGNPFEKEKPAGGPCTYTHDYFPLVVAEISMQDSNEKDLVFVQNSGQQTDTFLLSSLANKINKNDVLFNSIKVGDTCTLIRSHIKSGSCTPTINSIEFVSPNKAKKRE